MKHLIGALAAAAALGLGALHAQEAEDAAAFAEAPTEAVSEDSAAADPFAAPAGETAAEAPAEPAADPFAASDAGTPAEAPVDSLAPVEEAPVAEAPVETYEAPAPEFVAAEAAAGEAAVSEASAETRVGPQHYLAIMGTGTDADKDRGELSGADIDYAAGFSVLYGYQGESGWGYEVQGFNETFETDEPLRTDFYRYGLNVDLVYSFGDRTSFTPFLLIGAGGNYNDVFPQDDDFTWFANAGVGFVTGPVIETGNIRLRGEARYIHDDFEDGYGDIRIGLGIEIPLFVEKEIEVAAVVEPVQVVEVATGLKDDDGDGVINDKDQCPDTPAGERVDGNGCPLGKVIALNGVTFEFNKTRLRPDAQTILDLATDILKKYPDMQVEVAGHTDNIGGEAYNQKLSEGRAAAVRDYFVEKGVTNTLSVKGYGEAEPVADNESEEGRERNRRVELRILN